MNSRKRQLLKNTDSQKNAKKSNTLKHLSRVSGTSKESPRKLEGTSKDP
jgi:hypothetical protein